MPNLQLLLEAERRGILPANKKSLLDEARRRGLISGGEPSKGDYYEQLYGSAQAAQAAQASPAEEKPLGGFWDTFFERMKTIPSLADEAAAFAANPTEENRKAFIAAGDSKFRGVGFGEGENWTAFKQLLGGSLGQMVAPAAAATVGSFATPFAGVAAGFGTSATQYEIENLLRQAQEQESAAAEGRTPQELELGKSIAASAAQAGLDVVQFKYFEKLFRALPFTRNLLLPEKEAAQRAADELVDSYKAGRLRATPIGTVKDAAKGAAFEVPQELAQTVLERWQAGLSLSDDEAQEEYKQAAIGAAILGPLMGGAAGAVGRRGERIAAQEEIERREAAARAEREQREAAAKAGTTPPAPPAPPAPPEGGVPEEPTGAAQFEYSEQGVLERSKALGRSIRLQRLRQARPDLDTTTLDYLIEEGYTNKQILDYNKPTRAGREPLSIESYKAAAKEAAPEKTVRVYHSGSQGEGESGRWVSTDKTYASDYRPDLPLFYLDIPANDPRVRNLDYPEQGVEQGFTFNFELTPEEATQLKPIERTPAPPTTPEAELVAAPTPADVKVATEDLVATKATPEPDVRNLALEAIKTTPTIKAISEATGLNQPKAAAIMRGFVDEGIVERKGNKFKLVEAAKPEEAAAPKVEAAVETAPEAPAPSKSGAFAFEPKNLEALRVPEYKSREKLIELPIDDFLAMAKPGRMETKEAKTSKLLKEGTKFSSIPFLMAYMGKDGALKVQGHEGRHRALALKEAGYETMPVILKTDIRWSEQTDPKKFDYQAEWPTAMVSEDGTKTIPMPVSRDQALAPYPALPTTPPEAPRGTAPEPVAEEAVAEPVGRGAELPVPRPAPEGRAVAEPRGEGLGVPSEAAVGADERAAGVEPALTTAPAKNARAAGLEYVRSTGKADALGLQKATGLKLSQAKVLREALIGSGAIVPVPGKADLYTVAGEYVPTATARRAEAAETTTDEAAIEAARDRAAARLRAKSVEKEAAEAAADLASERAPAPKLRPTFKGAPKGELSEDVRRAFAQLEAEENQKKLARLDESIARAEKLSSDKKLAPEERKEQSRLANTLRSERQQAAGQRGLDLLGGMAKPSLSRAETKVLDDIKSAARYLNSSGQMNDQDRATYNAEISKPSPNLKKLRKLVDKVSSREPDAITEVERDEAFDADREQYELDEETYFYDRPDEYTRRGELKPLKFRRGEGRGLPANKVSAVVNGIIKGWKNAPKINVVQSVDELPGQNFPNTQGVYVNGQIYLVANNLKNDAEVKGTLFHEALGHFGLEQLFGSRLKEVMLGLYRTNKALQRQADQYLEMFPDTYAGETREDQIAFAVEEVIAEASAAGPKAKDASALRAAFNRVANLIRRFLNAMGFPVTYTNKEINEILIQAHGSVVAGQRKDRIGDGSAKYQRRRAEERLSTVLDVNISAPPYTNKVGDGVRSAFGNISDSLRQAAMGFLQVKDTAEIWKNDLPEIQTTDKILESRGGTEAARREEVNNHVVKWYKMSNKVSKKDPEMMNHFFKIANLTTVYQVDPLSDVDRAVLTKPVSKMDGQDRAAYDIIKEYDALPEDLRNAYKELRQYYEQKANELFELLGKVVGESALDLLKKKYNSKRLKVYLPLWRKGDYWLTYTDQNNETVTSAFASEIDRKRAIESLRAQGITNATPFTRLRDARNSKTAPPTGFLNEVLTALKDGGAPEYMIDSVYETFLNYLPADSIRQQFRSREESYDMATGTTRYGEFGFEPDVFQAFANVATRMANQLTNLEYAVPIEESLKKVYEQAGGKRMSDPVLRDVYENLVKQIDFIRNPQPNRFFDGASYFSYMWFIAGNISSAIVQTTQLPLVVAPLLGGKYGYDKAYKAMDKAMKTYFKGGFDNRSSRSRFAAPGDYTFGAAADLDPKYKKLYDTAVSRSIIRRSTGYEFTEARRVSTKDYVGIRAIVEGWLGWTFQNSERFNREVTLLAGFDLAYARTGDVNAAIEEAIKLTKDAHGSALAETGPRLFQQGFGKMMFTFKRFAQAQVYLLSRLFHQAMKGEDATTREVARSQLVGIFGAAYVLAGVQGMPLYGMAEFLASLVMDRDDDEPFDPTGYVNEAFTETGRKGLLSQMIGVDIASRTGFNGLLWREDYKRMSDIGPVLYTLEQAMGPAYAAFMGITRGIGLAGEGEYQRAIEAIAPSYIRNAWKTLRYAEDGVRNRDGTPVVEDVGAYNLMMQLVGFAPSEVSYARERASVAAKLEDKLTGRRSSLLDKFYAAWQEQDAEGMQEALEDIKKFNAKNPQKGLVITQSTLRKSVAGRVTRQQQSVDGLYIPMSVRNRIAQILPGD